MTFSDSGDEELSYRTPDANLGAMILIGGVALMVLLLMPKILWASRGPLSTPLVIGLLVLAWVAYVAWAAFTLRTRFFFGTSGVTYRQWRGSRWFAYADMAGCVVKRHDFSGARSGETHGWFVTFLPAQAGIAPLEMFVDDRAPIDARIVALLRTVPTLDSRMLKVLELATPKRVW